MDDQTDQRDTPPELAPFVACPETLGPLEPVDGGYWSPEAQRVYPVRHGLIFMGYPARDAAMIEATMREEHQWQGTGEAASSNLAFLRKSAPQAVDLINVAQRYVPRDEPAPRALELGCGNGWVSWLLAKAGFRTWMCDFEANSLATGLHLQHPNIGEGKRFVTDARYAPFRSDSFDLVMLKEFVHHVRDYKPLFREANRVLREGGVMVLMDPVRSVWKTIRELRHPDPHEGHHITWPDAYLRAIRTAGMDVVYQTPIYSPEQNRRAVAAWMLRRAKASISEARPAGNLLAKTQLRVFGGAWLVVVARKVRQLSAGERPAMRVISPDTIVVDDSDLAGYAEFPAVLENAAERLVTLP